MIEPLKNWYTTLQLKNGATLDEIKAQYKLLAKKYHPDFNKDPRAEGWMKLINKAYAFLCDPTNKRILDNALARKPAYSQPTSTTFTQWPGGSDQQQQRYYNVSQEQWSARMDADIGEAFAKAMRDLKRQTARQRSQQAKWYTTFTSSFDRDTI